MIYGLEAAKLLPSVDFQEGGSLPTTIRRQAPGAAPNKTERLLKSPLARKAIFRNSIRWVRMRKPSFQPSSAFHFGLPISWRIEL